MKILANGWPVYPNIWDRPQRPRHYTLNLYILRDSFNYRLVKTPNTYTDNVVASKCNLTHLVANQHFKEMQKLIKPISETPTCLEFNLKDLAKLLEVFKPDDIVRTEGCD